MCIKYFAFIIDIETNLFVMPIILLFDIYIYMRSIYYAAFLCFGRVQSLRFTYLEG